MQEKPKQRKSKIRSKGKSYPIQDSPFYKLRSRGRLSSVLGVDPATLQKLRSDIHYIRFTSHKGGKPREIHEPRYKLDRVHTRIASLLVRIKPPDYLHSGIKGRSNISNARIHLGSTRLLTCDLKSFFDSTSRSHIFDFFFKTMQCSPDVSDLLADLSCIDGHCPTGSRLSMPLAFYANRNMFLELEKLAVERAVTMTLYVDDLAFSGNRANKKLVAAVQGIAKKYNHTLKADKTRIYLQGAPKSVTGAIVAGYTLKAKNAHLKTLQDDFLRWEIGENAGPPDPKLKPRLIGRLSSLAEIDPQYRLRAKSFIALS